MRRAVVAVVVAFATVVAAAPHKVMVLALDGDADPALRKKLDGEVQKLARSIDGKVQTGNTTFPETASAVGCDPAQAACVDSVLSMLSVDELVWGTATTSAGTTTVTIRRASKGKPAREVTTTLSEKDPPSAIEAGAQPVFQRPEGAGSASGSAPAGSAQAGSAQAGSDVASGSAAGSAASSTAGRGEGSALPPLPPANYHDRNVGIGLAIGGGLVLVIGVALWESEASLQSDIDGHPTRTIQDINDLKSLEDKANRYAWAGNVMVVVGAAVGAYGAYYLWRDHKNATIAPAPVEQGVGATLVLGGRW